MGEGCQINRDWFYQSQLNVDVFDLAGVVFSGEVNLSCGQGLGCVFTPKPKRGQCEIIRLSSFIVTKVRHDSA